jgi:hypothetical protein
VGRLGTCKFQLLSQIGTTTNCGSASYLQFFSHLAKSEPRRCSFLETGNKLLSFNAVWNLLRIRCPLEAPRVHSFASMDAELYQASSCNSESTRTCKIGFHAPAKLTPLLLHDSSSHVQLSVHDLLHLSNHLVKTISNTTCDYAQFCIYWGIAYLTWSTCEVRPITDCSFSHS